MKTDIYSQGKRYNQVFQINSNYYNIKVLEKLYNKVCKISVDSFINDSYGSGFFIKFIKDNRDLYCLMTNEHVITREMVRKKVIVKISIEKPDINFMIKLDENERFIRSFDYMLMDIIIIEILPLDNVKECFFVKPNLNYRDDPSKIKNKKILIAHFPKGLTLQITDGPVEKINLNKNEFKNLASTDEGSSGGLIIEYDDDNILALGIHKQGSDNGNIGHFIHPICNCLENNNYIEELIYKEGIYRGEIVKNKREGYGELKMRNGEMYIGQWKKDKRNGYGIEYYKNKDITDKDIKYKGYFENNEYNGKGTYNWKNGEYYKGYFEKSKAYGEGTYHYFNGDEYKGNFINNLKEGKGSYICKNGNYYKGEWKNDVQNGIGEYYENKQLIYKGMVLEGVKDGKGEEYSSNGKEKYIGDFNNDEYHGNGELYLKIENKYYLFYKGEWKYGKKSGFGVEYYLNGKEKYRGDFNNDKYHGKGKLFLNNENKYYLFYNGEWKCGQRSGFGEEFLPNGKYIYKGLYDNNKYNDNKGNLSFSNGYYYIGNFINGKMHGEGILFFENDYHLNKTIEIFNNIIQNPIEIINDIEICTRNILKGDFSNIKRYEGYFVNNNKEGFGICNYKNGSCYSGEWKNDKYDGNGTFFKKNGEYIEGKWKNGKKNGHMILFDRYQNKLDEADFDEDNLINGSSSLIPQIKRKFLCLNI